MAVQVWFFAVAVGAGLLGLAICVASKRGTLGASVLTVVGLIGLGYYMFNGSEAPPVDPPDAGTVQRQ